MYRLHPVQEREGTNKGREGGREGEGEKEAGGGIIAWWGKLFTNDSQV